jgi:hypothetical protein
MPLYHNSTTPASNSGKKNIHWQYDSTPNLSGEFDLDVKSVAVSATGTVAILAIETVELVTTSSSDKTRTLPVAGSCADCIVLVKKVDSGSGIVIVQAAGSPSELIDTDTSVELTNQSQYVRLMSDGTQWHVIGNN